jgi:hypothetical protein
LGEPVTNQNLIQEDIYIYITHIKTIYTD